MKIIKAEIKHCADVLNITHTTIKSIYPHYYPEGAVNFFLDHHNENNILSDIKSEYVYILINKQKITSKTKLDVFFIGSFNKSQIDLCNIKKYISKLNKYR